MSCIKTGVRLCQGLWLTLAGTCTVIRATILGTLCNCFFIGHRMKDGLPLANHRRIVTSSQHILEVSISSTFYSKLLRAQILKAQKDSQVTSVVLGFWDLRFEHESFEKNVDEIDPRSSTCNARTTACTSASSRGGRKRPRPRPNFDSAVSDVIS